MTLSTLFEAYLKEYLPEVKPTSRHTWKSHARVLVGELGDPEVASIQERDIRFWVAQCRGRLRPASINHRLSFLRKTLEWGVGQGYLQTNPAKSIGGLKALNQRRRTLSVEEEATLKGGMAPKAFSIVRFFILTGLRRLELFRIQDRHIDWGRQLLYVEETKTDMPRVLPLHPEALQILLKWKEILPSPDAHLFLSHLNPARRWVAANHWYCRHLVPVLTRLEIVDLHAHDLRHTFASRLAEAGVPLYTIQQLLGHKDPSQTQRYAHLSTDHLRQAVYRAN